MFHPEPLEDASILPNKTIVIVPLKGSPIWMHSEHLANTIGSAFVGGIVGVIIGNYIENSITQPRRDTVAGQANSDVKLFDPERIMAEECYDLLKSSSLTKNQTIIIHKTSEAMEGSESLINATKRPITSIPNDDLAWRKIYRQWLSSSIRQYNFQADQPIGPFVVIEIVSTLAILKNNDELALNMAMRLVDPVSGKVLASTGTYVGEAYGLVSDYSIRPLNKPEDIPFFVEDFRKCIRQNIKNCLTALKLLV